MSGKSTTKRSKQLGELLGGVVLQVSTASRKIPVTGITSDSRTVQQGDLFVAVSGLTADGHCFISSAVEKGCAAVIAEHGVLPPEQLEAISRAVTVVTVKDSRQWMGLAAANFHNRPAEKLCAIGITGTNGKTTTTYLVESIIRAAGGSPGVIGTINYRYLADNGKNIVRPAPLTTPEPVQLHGIIREMVDAGVTHLIMEVSSHALVQKRLSGLLFDIAIFTNLSHDHLDFHGNMQGYFKGKKILFQEHLKERGAAIIQLEPRRQTSRQGWWGRSLTEEMKEMLVTSGPEHGKLLTCGTENDAAIFPRSLTVDLHGIRAKMKTPNGTVDITSPLTGMFNVKNILSAVAAAVALDIPMDAIERGINKLPTVPGRLERIIAGETPGPVVFVDYAHTPDALGNVLVTLHQCGATGIICVFGCGGDRDREKRPLMGSIAARHADIVILTNDNPRSEPAAQILAQIEVGLTGMDKISADTVPGKRGYMVVESRRQAIRAAILRAASSDIVVICGKGHEDYQIIGDSRLFFDDRLEAREALQERTH